MAGSPISANVSRETLYKLEALHDLVLKWNPAINLVSKSSVDQLWERHIWDSAQIAQLNTTGRLWVDIGSGGGFPGLVVAILSLETMPERKIVMIESDTRKAAFLRTCIRELELSATVLSDRIEKAAPQAADVLSARALADLGQLLEYAKRHLGPQGTALFMKGANWKNEVETARGSWSFSLQAHTSGTNPAAAILEIKDIERA